MVAGILWQWQHNLVVNWNVYATADVTFDLWLPTILDQVVVNTSVMESCLPFLEPLIVPNPLFNYHTYFLTKQLEKHFLLFSLIAYLDI